MRNVLLVLAGGFIFSLGCNSTLHTDTNKQHTRHWLSISADHYRNPEVCVDQDGKIVGLAIESYPSSEPGIWYARDGDEQTLGMYPAPLLAKRAVEKHVGGCPGYTDLVETPKAEGAVQ